MLGQLYTDTSLVACSQAALTTPHNLLLTQVLPNLTASSSPSLALLVCVLAVVACPSHPSTPLGPLLFLLVVEQKRLDTRSSGIQGVRADVIKPLDR